MKDRVFYTDINLFGYDEKKLFLEEGSSYYVGNIVDLKFTSNKAKAIKKIKEIKNFAKDRYISGDKELTRENMLYKEDGILITYGDNIFNNRKIRRPLLCFIFGSMYNSLDKLFRRKEPSQMDLFLIAKKAFHNKCSTVVMSYFNNKKIIDFEYNNIRIIILPRGRTCIQV